MVRVMPRVASARLHHQCHELHPPSEERRPLGRRRWLHSAPSRCVPNHRTVETVALTLRGPPTPTRRCIPPRPESTPTHAEPTMRKNRCRVCQALLPDGWRGRTNSSHRNQHPNQDCRTVG